MRCSSAMPTTRPRLTGRTTMDAFSSDEFWSVDGLFVIFANLAVVMATRFFGAVERNLRVKWWQWLTAKILERLVVRASANGMRICAVSVIGGTPNDRREQDQRAYGSDWRGRCPCWDR